MSLCVRRQTCLAERAFPKIVGQRQFPDLGVQRLHVDSRLVWTFSEAGIEPSVGSYDCEKMRAVWKV